MADMIWTPRAAAEFEEILYYGSSPESVGRQVAFGRV